MATPQPPTAGRVPAPPAAAQAPPPAAPPPGAAVPPPLSAPKAAGPAAGEAPAAPAVRPVINVAARFRELNTIRILALMFMMIAASMSITDSILGVGGITTLSGAGIGLTLGAIICGLIAIINQRNRLLNNITSILAVALLVAGVTTRPAILTLGKMSLGSADFILAFLFAVFFLLFLEYMHGVRRFWEIGEMAIEKNLKEFDFGHVLRQYIAMGFIWLVVILILSVAVVGIQLALINFLPAQAGQSAEMNSVYGLAIAEGLFFVIAAVVLSLIMGRGEIAKSLKASPKAAPSASGPTMAQAYVPGQSAQQTGLSATAPPPRAQ